MHTKVYRKKFIAVSKWNHKWNKCAIPESPSLHNDAFNGSVLLLPTSNHPGFVNIFHLAVLFSYIHTHTFWYFFIIRLAMGSHRVFMMFAISKKAIISKLQKTNTIHYIYPFFPQKVTLKWCAIFVLLLPSPFITFCGLLCAFIYQLLRKISLKQQPCNVFNDVFQQLLWHVKRYLFT